MMRIRIVVLVHLASSSLVSIAFAGTASSTVAAPTRPYLSVDLVTDTAIVASTASFGVILEAIIGTGELRPQMPVDPDALLGIDRGRAKSDTIQDNGFSNIGLGAMVAYAVTEVALASVLDRGGTWSEYFLLYAETIAITFAVTNLTKIAVRRPRPSAYHDVRLGTPADSTNSALSFFSGHASISGAIAGTAAYLAWQRGSALEAWLVTIGGGSVTAIVSMLRVLEGKHFPTDVIAGSVIGMGIGVLVPHLHLDTPIALSTSTLPGGATIGVTMGF